MNAKVFKFLIYPYRFSASPRIRFDNASRFDAGIGIESQSISTREKAVVARGEGHREAGEAAEDRAGTSTAHTASRIPEGRRRPFEGIQGVSPWHSVEEHQAEAGGHQISFEHRTRTEEGGRKA